MPKLIMDIPAEHVDRVVAALKQKYPSYEDELILTDVQMAKEAVRLWIIRVIKETERAEALRNLNIAVPDEVVTGEVEAKK